MPSRTQTDAITLLKKDHEKVRGLLSKLERAAERNTTKAQEILEQIDREVKIHSQIEEEIFYPAFRDAAQKRDDRELYFEAKEEHHVVDMVMPEVSEFDSEEEFAAKAKVLKDLIEHHAGEEEKQMFPKAKKLFDRDELRELGDRLKARKRELMR
ncbi:MAG TPA: hemerythrin domain-containing protein [Thermoanaerobaculia bacterium]|nr:hemerythrin domain-containing protein [Thermoanaerobaculia bacterium]